MAQSTRQAVSYIGLIVISAILSYVLIGASLFPYLALAIFFTTVASLIFLSIKQKTNFVSALFAAILFFSFFLYYRANMFLSMLNIVAIIFLGSVLIEHAKYNAFGFVQAFFSPLFAFFRGLVTRSKFKVPLKAIEIDLEKHGSKIPEITVGLIITVFVLAIILPLLASANPIFSDFLKEIVTFFNVPKLIQELFSNAVYTFRVLCFLVLVFYLPRLLTYVGAATRDDQKSLPLLKMPNLLIPKIAVAAVLVIFFVTQLQLYFADGQTLATLGYNHSKLTREVFGQLSVVTFIVFLLIYNDKKEARWSKLSTVILLLEGLFLGLIATKSDLDYIATWGFTFKRLYGIAGVIWLFGIFCLFAVKYFERTTSVRFVKAAILFTALVLIGINVANFDHLIYYKAKATTGEGIDHFYLSRLSPDADSYRAHLALLMKGLEEDNLAANYKNVNAAYNVINTIERIRRKYDSPDFRSFNITEYKQYKDTLDLPLSEYRTRLNRVSQSVIGTTNTDTSHPLPQSTSVPNTR